MSHYKNEKIIVGRKSEIDALKKSFDKTLEDSFNIVNIIGAAGSGKTYLAEHSRLYYVNNGATYIDVKFNQFSKNDFTTLANIIDSIIKRILALDNSSFLIIQKELNNSLGSRIDILFNISSVAKKLFTSKSVKTNIDISSDKNDIVDVFCEFIGLASRIFFPLVIFIDDLQWADEISLNCVERLSESKNISILVLLAYRDNAKEYERLTKIGKKTIAVGRFCKSDIRDYLEVKYKKLEGISYLTDFITSVTKGNAFYFALLIEELVQKNIIYKVDGKYYVDRDKLGELNVSGHMQNAICEEIENLDKDRLFFLQVLACFGGKSSSDILTKACGYEVGTIKRICDSIKSYIIFDFSENIEEKNISFIHDIIYNLVIRTLPTDEKIVMCIKIMNLLQKTSRESYLLDNHYEITPLVMHIGIDGLDRIDNIVWAKVLFKSAIEARNKQAFDYSLEIFKICEKLSFANKTLNLYTQLEYMTCEFICEKEIEAKKRYDILCQTFKDKQDLIEIKLRYMYFYSYSANWEKVLSQGREILSLLRFSFSVKSMIYDLIKSIFQFSKRNIKNLANKKEIKDRRLLIILEVLTIMFPAANRIDEKTFNLVNIKLANISMKYGDSKYSAIGLSAYVYILFFLFKKIKKGDLLQKAILEMLDDEDSIYQKSIPYALIGTFTYHWSNSYAETLEILNQSIENGEIENEHLYSNYAIVFSIITKYVSGGSLDEVEKLILSYRVRKKRLENYLTRQMYQIYISQINYFRFGKATYVVKLEQGKKAFFDTIDLNAKMIEVHRLYLESEYEKGYKISSEIQDEVWNKDGFMLNGTFDFYNALNRIKHHYTLCDKEKRINVSIIKKILCGMKRWSNAGNKAHLARYLLLKSEYDNLICGKESDKGYYKALEFVGDNLQLEALCNLMLARYFVKHNEKTAKFFACESAELYKKWGANYIHDKIYSDFSIKENIDTKSNKELERLHREKKPKISHLSIIEPYNSEETWIYLLNHLKNQYNVINASILFEQNADMYIYYSEQKKLSEPINMNFSHNMPNKLIRYIQRYEKQIIINSVYDYEFLFDETDSIKLELVDYYCLPIKNKKVLIGILYFEVEKSKSFGNTALKDILSLLKYIADNRTSSVKATNVISENLTKRETEILKLVERGMSNVAISEELFISSGTVRNHLSKIYSKLDAQSRIQAVVKAKEFKMI